MAYEKKKKRFTVGDSLNKQRNVTMIDVKKKFQTLVDRIKNKKNLSISNMSFCVLPINRYSYRIYATLKNNIVNIKFNFKMLIFLEYSLKVLEKKKIHKYTVCKKKIHTFPRALLF